MSNEYDLRLSQDQAWLLIRALDLYARIGMGQFEEVSAVFDPASHAERETLHAKLLDAKGAVGLPRNGHLGIHNEKVNDDFRQAWDILQVVRHRLAWDKTPEGGIQVWFDEPRRAGTPPLPTIARVVKEST